MYEVIEHTADVGLRVVAGSVDELFAEAGRGLVTLMVPNAGQVAAPAVPDVAVELLGESVEALLVDWLSELVFIFETRQLVPRRFDVAVNEAALRLRAAVGGARLDRRRHRLGHEVKAVTYHQLSVRRGEQGWEARVIFDI